MSALFKEAYILIFRCMLHEQEVLFIRLALANDTATGDTCGIIAQHRACGHEQRASAWVADRVDHLASFIKMLLLRGGACQLVLLGQNQLLYKTDEKEIG
jgi:hypothetical protein